MNPIPYSSRYTFQGNPSSGIPYSSGMFGQVAMPTSEVPGASTPGQIPYSPGTFQQPSLGQSGASSAPSTEARGGGFNAGAAIAAGGELIGDIGGISKLSGINAGKLVDTSSFAGQNQFDTVGAFNNQSNPFQTSTGEDLAGIGASGLKYAATGASFGPVGALAGAIVGLGLGAAKQITGQRKAEQFARAQNLARARYAALKQQQLDYQQKQQQNRAMNEYISNRYANSYNY